MSSRVSSPTWPTLYHPLATLAYLSRGVENGGRAPRAFPHHEGGTARKVEGESTNQRIIVAKRRGTHQGDSVARGEAVTGGIESGEANLGAETRFGCGGTLPGDRLTMVSVNSIGRIRSFAGQRFCPSLANGEAVSPVQGV